MLKQLIVNTLIFWKDKNTTERVLWADNQRDIAFVIDIFANSYSPAMSEVSSINYNLSCGYAEILNDDPWIKIIHEQDIKESSKERRDKAWAIISYILKSCEEPLIFNAEIRSKYIKKASDKYSISEKTIREYFRKYFQRGKTKNALLPDYYKSGGKGNEKNDSKNKRGRPSNYKLKGINVDKKMKETCLC